MTMDARKYRKSYWNVDVEITCKVGDTVRHRLRKRSYPQLRNARGIVTSVHKNETGHDVVSIDWTGWPFGDGNFSCTIPMTTFNGSCEVITENTTNEWEPYPIPKKVEVLASTLFRGDFIIHPLKSKRVLIDKIATNPEDGAMTFSFFPDKFPSITLPPGATITFAP